MATLLSDITSDLPTFLADFGEDVVYTPTGGSAATIKMIFDEPGSILSLKNSDLIVEAPQGVCRSSDVSSISVRDVIVRSGVTYYVSDYVKDGTGITTVTLKEV